MNHTPGPWRITDRIYNGEVIKHDNDWIAVLSDFNRYDRDAEREANARLIAAAPDLLEACKYWLEDGRFLVSNTIEHQAAVDMLRAAIAKAEGKS